MSLNNDSDVIAISAASGKVLGSLPTISV